MLRSPLLGLVSLTALVPMFVACGGTSHDSVSVSVVEDSEPRIVGGTQSDSSQDSTVYLNMGDEFCSGVMIAPNLLITARHCVETMNDNAGDCGEYIKDNVPSDMRISLGSDAPDEAVVARGKAFFHDTEVSMCSHDIALVQLDRAIPGAMLSPIRFAPVLKAETDMVAVGYGSTDNNNTLPDGRLQRGGISVQGTADTTYTYTTKKGTNFTVVVSPGEFATGESTCFGDSGGPIFDKDGNIVGVTSRGIDQYCIDRPSIWSDMTSHQKLIMDAASTAGATLTITDPTLDAGPPDSGSAPAADAGSGSSGNGSSGTSGNSGNSGSSGNSGGSGLSDPGSSGSADQTNNDSPDAGSGSSGSQSSGGCSATGKSRDASHGGTALLGIALGIALIRRRRASRVAS